jgi:ArsR family transcriptional regulator
MKLTSRQTRELFAVLGDRVRLRLACCLLLARDGLSVSELVDALGEPQPNVSRHLRLMRAAGLVEERREGRWVYYALVNARHAFYENLRCCVETVCCCGDIQEDLRRLRRRMRLRRGGRCVVSSARTPQSRARRTGKGGRR